MQTKTIKSFKVKDAILKKIGVEYRKLKLLSFNSIINEEESFYLEKKNNEYYNNVRDKVDYILLQMEERLAFVVVNEYLSTRNDNWWIYYFSKSTYYRIKNKAMNSFLEWWNA